MKRRWPSFLKNRDGLVFASLMFSAFILLLLSTRSLTGVPERIGLSITSLGQSIAHGAQKSVTDATGALAQLRDLRTRYQEALVRLEQYGNLERGYAQLRQENIRLKEQLGFSSRLEYAKLPAEVIARDPENLFPTIVINKGVRDGIRKNMPVIAWQDGMIGLVGRVSDVGLSTSIVLPVYEGKSHVAARFEKTRYEGLLSGQGADSTPLLVRYVKKRAKEEIQYGDLIVTSGMNSIYPRGIAVGRVARLLQTDFKTSIEYEVEPVVDFARLEYVFVILDRQEPPR